MDGTYIPVLKQLLFGPDETESLQLHEEFKQIVRAMDHCSCHSRPLSINSLSPFVGREAKI